MSDINKYVPPKSGRGTPRTVVNGPKSIVLLPDRPTKLFCLAGIVRSHPIGYGLILIKAIGISQRRIRKFICGPLF